MCGRYTLTSSGEELARHFEAQQGLEPEPRYNIAPTQDVPIVRIADADGNGDATTAGRRRLAMHRWGLVPHWAKDPTIGSRMINARSETAATKPAFRDAIRRRRCVVPMTGFYEWQRRGGRKQPSWIHPAEGQPPLWAAAGLWERWRDERGAALDTTTVLTTAANDAIAPLHDRMPVLLDDDGVARWLEPSVEEPAALADLLTPWPAERTSVRTVSRRVNDARAQGPALLDPPDPPAQGELFGSS